MSSLGDLLGGDDDLGLDLDYGGGEEDRSGAAAERGGGAGGKQQKDADGYDSDDDNRERSRRRRGGADDTTGDTVERRADPPSRAPRGGQYGFRGQSSYDGRKRSRGGADGGYRAKRQMTSRPNNQGNHPRGPAWGYGSNGRPQHPPRGPMGWGPPGRGPPRPRPGFAVQPQFYPPQGNGQAQPRGYVPRGGWTAPPPRGRVSPPRPQVAMMPNAGARPARPHAARSPQGQQQSSCTLMVSNVPAKQCTIGRLAGHFGRFGEIVNVKVHPL